MTPVASRGTSPTHGSWHHSPDRRAATSGRARPRAARARRPGGAALWLLPALVACGGCASSLDPAPFRQFRAAVEETRSGMDEALSLGADWTREALIESFAADSSADFSELILAFDAGYAWSLADSSTYLALQATRSALGAFNGALAGYATLLHDLAAAQLTDESTYELLARDLNQSAAGIAHATGARRDPGELALISTAASDLFRRSIGARQTGILRQAVAANQASIQRMAGHGIALVRILRDNITDAYLERFAPIRVRWLEARAGKRAKPTEEMLDLNDDCIQALRVLSELESAFAALPPAHAALAAAGDPAADDLAIHRFFESARRLKRLHAELRARGAAVRTGE